VSPVGWFLQKKLTIDLCLQIYKKKCLWFSLEMVSMLNIVSSSCYIYVIASLWFMSVKKKKIALY
jgi:hypothetical protein